jgi:hypothetical protein
LKYGVLVVEEEAVAVAPEEFLEILEHMQLKH